MADIREPPPLFDDDDSRKEDDDNDLFSSAVQSPVNGQVTSDVAASNGDPVTLDSKKNISSSTLVPSENMISDRLFSDPLQSNETPSNFDGTASVSSDKVNSNSFSLAQTSDTDIHEVTTILNDSTSLASGSELTANKAMLESNTSLEDDGGPSILDISASNVMTSTAITNLPPVPSNMYNISSMDSVEDSSNGMDLFESCVQDAVVRPFSSVNLDAPQEVSLDDDDDGLFSGGALDKPQSTFSSVSSELTLPAMGVPITPSTTAPPITKVTNNDTNSMLQQHTSTATPSAPGFYTPADAPVAPAPNRVSVATTPSEGELIEILIQEPQKVGDGMGSYMAYKMTTRTNIPFFKKQCWSVTRRFSDYLGLHAKLVEKHLHAGRIVPPAPEKDALNTTKIRLSSTDGVEGAAEFLERRRASLQRYMQRTVALAHLRADPDLREFVELDSDLPKATQTSAMSGAGMMRLFNRVGETVNKITFKMEELDQWFEERVHQIEALEVELRRLHGALEGLSGGRRELAVCSSSLSKAAAVLSSVEEHSALSRALHQLAEATDRTHTVYHAQADADFYILCETTRDYINLIGAVKDVFHERVKVYQSWQYSRTMLAKKRDAKAKLELTARQDKVTVAQQEVQEWENKVEHNQEHFERISASIKKELEQFDIVRVKDFKNMLVRYLEAMVTSQQQVIKVWESFLPEAKAIS